jgi:CheY-like chemotaxis protein
MDKQASILIVDDDEHWCKELVELLQKNGFHAEAACSVSQALERMSTTLYHILILDIRMKDDSDNKDGIQLLRELEERGLNKAIKVIMLSAYGTIEHVREAFIAYKVADFLSKDEANGPLLLDKVRQVFEKEVNINLSLEVRWQELGGLEQVVTGLKVDGTLVKPGTALQSQIAAELEDLFCRLFYQAKSILVRPLTQGYSGMGVLRVQPFYASGGGGHNVVVKFGDFRKIEKEYRNFKKYVQPFLGGGRNTSAIDLRRTPHLGGIIYSLLGTINDQLVHFGDFYHRADVPRIKEILDRLFLDTCSVWYANRGLLQPLDLAPDYQEMLGCTPEMLEKIVAEELPSVQLTQSLIFTNLKAKRFFTNPLRRISGLSLNRSTYLCITHGDFHQQNLLVDSTGHVWMIDFQDTGQSHILRDLATLDSTVRFQLLTAEKATLRERLSIEEILCTIEHFSQVEQLPTILSTKNQTLAKAYATVVHLRTLAHRLVGQNPNNDMSEYNIALLYNALNAVQFSSLSQTQREHALLCASLLVDKLGLTRQ